jgi:hypothetical protein
MSWTLLGLGVAWFAGMLWAADASIVNAGSQALAIANAAYSLPGVLAAAVLAGAASGIVAVGLIDRGGLGGYLKRSAGQRSDGGTPSPTRFVVALAGGLAVGLVALVVILIGYGHHSSIVVLASAVMGAAALGGLAGGFRAVSVAVAGITATMASFLIATGLTFGPVQGHLMRLFGAGRTLGSLVTAAQRIQLTGSLVSGVVAGLVGFIVLRRLTAGARVLGYLLAGGTAGILLLIADVVTLVGGAQLFDLVGAQSLADRAAVNQLGSSLANHALVVFFAGAVTSLIAFGRTLQPPSR